MFSWSRLSIVVCLNLLCSVSAWGQADTLTPILTFTEHTNNVYRIVFSPDGEYIASTVSGMHSLATKVWKTIDGTLLQTYDPGFSSLCFSSDGTVLAGFDYSRGYVSFFEFPSLRLARTFPLQVAEHGWLTHIAISLDDNTLAISRGSSSMIEFWVWEWSTLEKTGQVDLAPPYPDASMSVREMTFSPIGHRLLVGCEWSTERMRGFTERAGMLVDVPSLKVIAEYHDYSRDRLLGYPVAYSPEGSYYALVDCGRNLGDVIVFDARTLELVNRIDVERGDFVPQGGLAFSPDGKKLLAASNLYEVATGQLLRSFPIRVYFNPAAYSPDGNTVAISDFTDIKIFDVSDLNTGVDDWAERGE